MLSIHDICASALADQNLTMHPLSAGGAILNYHGKVWAEEPAAGRYPLPDGRECPVALRFCFPPIPKTPLEQAQNYAIDEDNVAYTAYLRCYLLQWDDRHSGSFWLDYKPCYGALRTLLRGQLPIDRDAPISLSFTHAIDFFLQEQHRDFQAEIDAIKKEARFLAIFPSFKMPA